MNLEGLELFVASLCVTGRTDAQIVAVARSSRWKDRVVELKALLSEKGVEYRKMEKIPSTEEDPKIVSGVEQKPVFEKEIAMDRKIVNSLLTKLGVDAAAAGKLDNERAMVKLAKRLNSKGIPADATEEEKEAISELSTDDSTPQAEEPGDLEVEDKEPKAKAKKEKAEEPKAKAPKTEKVEKAEKPAKKDKATKTEKPEAGAMDDEKDAATDAPKKDRRPRSEGAAAIFRMAFRNRKTQERDALIADICAKAGCSESTVKTYITDSKGKKSPFEFDLTETETKDGKRILTRVDR